LSNNEFSKEYKTVHTIVINEMIYEWKMLTSDRILEIFKQVCGENAKKCFTCHKEMEARNLFFGMDLHNERNRVQMQVGHEQPFLCLWSTEPMFTCGKISCFSEGMFSTCENAQSIALEPTTYAEVCDFCFVQCASLHRCNTCKTKQYCGIECQTKDWKLVHREICGKGDLRGKKKGGRKTRKSRMQKEAADSANDAEVCVNVR